MSTSDKQVVAGVVEVDAASVRRVQPTDDLAGVFSERASSVGMYVSRSTADGVGPHVANLLDTMDKPRALLESQATGAGVPSPSSRAGSPSLEEKKGFRWKVLIEPSLFCRSAITSALADRADLLDPGDGDRAMFTAHVGITGVTAAVAETGSLVCGSGVDVWRGMSLIPPVHIAIVRVDQIVPDLVDLFGGLSSSRLPASLSIITGPSKTADIEGILITGVHGPGAVWICVVK